MKVRLSHIHQRGNTFYFRLIIPEDLRIHFGGKREISKSLRTIDPFAAFAQACELRDRYKRQFHAFRHGSTIPAEQCIPSDFLMPLNIAQLKPRNEAPLLSVVLHELLQSKPCKKTSISARKAAVRLLIEWHGDLPVDHYTRKMLLEFRDKGLLRLPPNFYKINRYVGRPIRSIAEECEAEAMKPATVNHKLGHINTVFNYAVKYGYLDINPVVDLTLSLEKAPSKERDSYSVDQLQRMVNQLAVQTASGGDLRHQRFWVTLCCLYTGARLNEIAQLSVSDLCVVDDIPCFNITTEGEVAKSLKNARSRRLIPVHPALIELGLLRYHEQRRADVSDPAIRPQ
ncbi:hypothetical protein PDESU_03004 [Pontiella desulfatans]|uniref:Core-binding (CB) domain-containing protein n=1 Tax=Pontiella desulfatans TaxID=2750659 RepID=A0A6C2U3H2_PONDE|nr:DUF6538 domain-containing protein [Pontiella desulfatans]VGO14443.1 hypothetical protein PDESU_03004 [Pontiella desulfatans]